MPPDGIPASYRDLLTQREQRFHAAISNGEIEPFIYPFDTLSAAILLLALLFIPRAGGGQESTGRRRHGSVWPPHTINIINIISRYCAFAMIVLFSTSTMRWCRMLGMGGGYGIGLIGVWTVVWSAVLLLYNDPAVTFQRVEWRDARDVKKDKKEEEKEEERWEVVGEGVGGRVANGSAPASTSKSTDDALSRSPPVAMNSGDRRVYGVFGGSYLPATEIKGKSRDITTTTTTTNPTRRKLSLVWQPYPTDGFRHRLDWVVDLCCSFRGPGWNWRIQTLPEAEFCYPAQPSMSTTATATATISTSTTNTTPASSSSRKLLIRIALRDFLVLYILIDILKTAMMADPYFWGVIPIDDRPPTPGMMTYLPQIIIEIRPLLIWYRVCLSLVFVVVELSFIFSLCPLAFGVLLPLLNLDRYTRAPLREPFLYPPYWGSFGKDVLMKKGLAGWWGSWWHQMFRTGMSEPSRVAIDKLGWDSSSQKAKMLQLFTAFAISGLIHAGASHTTYNTPTRPLSGPFRFFLAQAMAIATEQFVFKTMGLSARVRNWPLAPRRAGTLLYVLTWCYFTGPWLADDFARGGVWLFEPVPFSVIRGLGLGARGEGWWCWHGTWARWSAGVENAPWGKMGLAIL